MSDQLSKAISAADKITSLAEDGLRDVGRTIAPWPPEFRAIVWDAIAQIASRRAIAARAAVGTGKQP